MNIIQIILSPDSQINCIAVTAKFYIAHTFVDMIVQCYDVEANLIETRQFSVQLEYFNNLKSDEDILRYVCEKYHFNLNNYHHKIKYDWAQRKY
jgi:hypothetical protein